MAESPFDLESLVQSPFNPDEYDIDNMFGATFNGEFQLMDVDPMPTILDLKKHIESVMKIPARIQVIKFNDKYMNDNEVVMPEDGYKFWLEIEGPDPKRFKLWQPSQLITVHCGELSFKISAPANSKVRDIKQLIESGQGIAKERQQIGTLGAEDVFSDELVLSGENLKSELRLEVLPAPSGGSSSEQVKEFPCEFFVLYATGDGRSGDFTLPVDSELTGAEIKKRIEEIHGFPTAAQTIVLPITGSVLEDKIVISPHIVSWFNLSVKDKTDPFKKKLFMDELKDKDFLSRLDKAKTNHLKDKNFDSWFDKPNTVQVKITITSDVVIESRSDHTVLHLKELLRERKDVGAAESIRVFAGGAELDNSKLLVDHTSSGLEAHIVKAPPKTLSIVFVYFDGREVQMTSLPMEVMENQTLRDLRCKLENQVERIRFGTAHLFVHQETDRVMRYGITFAEFGVKDGDRLHLVNNAMYEPIV